ncbi:hypothetical protein VZT92_008569 [Zoarces viviparus]|uniref:Uncharacterized protein n=1 Tax=Zoarces viviparus TaxID=48416 RepID=A0AAW1FFQ1_ZOAVI
MSLPLYLFLHLPQPLCVKDDVVVLLVGTSLDCVGGPSPYTGKEKTLMHGEYLPQNDLYSLHYYTDFLGTESLQYQQSEAFFFYCFEPGLDNQ